MRLSLDKVIFLIKIVHLSVNNFLNKTGIFSEIISLVLLWVFDPFLSFLFVVTSHSFLWIFFFRFFVSVVHYPISFPSICAIAWTYWNHYKFSNYYETFIKFTFFPKYQTTFFHFITHIFQVPNFSLIFIIFSQKVFVTTEILTLL